MSDNFQPQIDELRANVLRLAQGLQDIRRDLQLTTRITYRGQSNEPDEKNPADGKRASSTSTLAGKAHAQVKKGIVASSGSYNSGSQGYQWNLEEMAETLLDQDEERVTRVLMAIGNKQRLALLKAILEQPASAAELVERLGMGTTGQVYHHLKALQAADLVTQEGRGQFVFVSHRVPSFLMLLAGVHNMLDTSYSSGNWEDQPTS